MIPPELIQYKEQEDTVVAFVVCGEIDGANVYLAMSGEDRTDAAQSLQEHARGLWEHLRRRPNCQLGYLPQIQKEFLRKHMQGERKVKVNGYQLRAALEEAKLVLATTNDQFGDCLYAFEGEEKKTPQDVVGAIRSGEHRVAEIQALQEAYNQQVQVKVEGVEMTLALAIKVRGYASRIEALWKQAARGRQADRYYRDDPTKRDKESEYAKATITKDDAIASARTAARWTNALKTAIATANLTEVEMELKFEL